jgi:broad specificity phosphatase PhoE
MRTLWLARHAQRQDFADPTWHTTADRPHDPGLSPDGTAQAQRLAERVARIRVDRIVSSPFLQAVETAHPAAESLHLPLPPGTGPQRMAQCGLVRLVPGHTFPLHPRHTVSTN